MNDKVYFWMVPRVEYLKYKNISLQSLFRNIFVPKKLSKLNGYFSFSKKKKKYLFVFTFMYGFFLQNYLYHPSLDKCCVMYADTL